MKNKLVSRFIIGTFVSLYLLVSIISTIHVIDFFELSNPRWMAITLAVGFEIGAAASLASLIIMDRMNKTLVWSLFIAITLMQINGNLYYAFINMQEYGSWVELFNLLEWEDLEQKRLLSAVSGAILPLVALGFIKSLVDYIKPTEDELISEDVAGFDDAAREDDEYFEDEDEYFEDEESFSNPTEEELRAAEEALDKWREERLGTNNEDWEDDQALDQVLNKMADEIEGELEPWDNTLADGLEDLEDDEDLALEKALEQKAEEDKEEYLKNRDNANS
jgi:hypothetical protein